MDAKIEVGDIVIVGEQGSGRQLRGRVGYFVVRDGEVTMAFVRYFAPGWPERLDEAGALYYLDELRRTA